MTPPTTLGCRWHAADVERWLAELALTPDTRAERDGVVSWDLTLDGRRRFDVPVTLILDPSLALVVWVHFAPPIGDMFRKSYRKLLRWNDEFPFVKFSLAEDERPILAAELPIAGAGARRRSGWPSPGPWRSATSCSRNRRAGCGSAAACRRPARPGAAKSGCSPGYAGRASPELIRAPRDPGHRGAARDGGTARCPSPCAPVAGGLLAARGRSRPIRAAAPDLTIVTDARYDVQPDQHRVRVTVDTPS